MKKESSKQLPKKVLLKTDVRGPLTAFAKSLNYNGVKIFTDYGAKKAVKDFMAVRCR